MYEENAYGHRRNHPNGLEGISTWGLQSVLPARLENIKIYGALGRTLRIILP